MVSSRLLTTSIVLSTLAFTFLVVCAKADPEVGQPAPDFALPDQTGKIHRLADYRGKTVILAFYPKDFTGG